MPANPVPAAAVRQEARALGVSTGPKARVGGMFIVIAISSMGRGHNNFIKTHWGRRMGWGTAQGPVEWIDMS